LSSLEVATLKCLFVADMDNHTIRQVDTETGVVITLAGSPGLGGIADD
jgi:hypothetical protein